MNHRVTIISTRKDLQSQNCGMGDPAQRENTNVYSQRPMKLSFQSCRENSLWKGSASGL